MRRTDQEGAAVPGRNGESASEVVRTAPQYEAKLAALRSAIDGG
jgi:hypothetical protein